MNRNIYETKQDGKTISDYYTEMKVLWEEVDTLNSLPPITSVTNEVTTFVEALNQQQEEQKLFQFLNGLHDIYGPQRSNLLMMASLPTVEIACSTLQQEENQREILKLVKEEVESVAMYSKCKDVNVCSVCNKTLSHQGCLLVCT